jgi:DNA-binding NtrC family response regulator
VRALHQIRVLLVGRDPHFVKVVGFLFSREGFAVATTRKPGQALELVARHRANVVILDASDSLAAAARLAAAIEALHPSVDVVAVAEDGASTRMSSFSVLAKWDFAPLVEEVERLYVKSREEKEVHLGAR